MPNASFVDLDKLDSTNILSELEEYIKKAAEANGMEYELWHQDDAISYLERWEGNFRRIIQISLHKDASGLFVVFLPGLERYEGKKRYISSSIPEQWMQTLYFSDLNEQGFIKAVEKAVYNSYCFTPKMLDREDEMLEEFCPPKK